MTNWVQWDESVWLNKYGLKIRYELSNMAHMVFLEHLGGS